MNHGLSGYIPVRNGFALDYCWVEAARSLLPVCDELILCDSDSTDGTREAMDAWANGEPKIRVINYPWPTIIPTYDQFSKGLQMPPSGPSHFVKWLNFAREHCERDMQITTDADEVLCEGSHAAIEEAVERREARWFHRLNFWRDAQHRTPDGCVVGSHAARLGPTELEMPTDEPRPSGEAEIRLLAKHDARLRFFHYGFIRRDAGFFAKSKVVQPMFCGSYDDRLKKAEESGKPWHAFTDVGELVEFRGEHPPCMRDWLTERGYDWRAKL